MYMQLKKCFLAAIVLSCIGLNGFANQINPLNCTNDDFLVNHLHDVLPCAESTLPITPINYKFEGSIKTNEFTVVSSGRYRDPKITQSMRALYCNWLEK